MLPVTITSDHPLSALTDAGVRLPVDPSAVQASGLETVRPGQRLLARTIDGVVVELTPITTPVAVHFPGSGRNKSVR